ncbi:MAG: MOSC domain-containing protein [Dehalococcoidia bacterium]|nr:MOSC domain-containing protein [Dehalococcoidia bacterium]
MIATVLAVCRSKDKGTRKKPAKAGLFKEELGLVGDAHADGTTHRQISLLAEESIEKMRQMGLEVGPGDFAENLTTRGIDLPALPVGARLLVGKDVLLEITQIGKECHTRCAIFQQVGTCVMPLEGVFARVIRGGVVRPGDSIEVKA